MNNLTLNKLKTLILVMCLLISADIARCCTIVSWTKNGKAYAAGNEDDYSSTLYPRIWFNPATKDRYGTVCFGLADLQAQTIMNEHGLFVDFTMQVSIDPTKLNLKNPYWGDLWFEILGHCKTVDEALKFFQRVDYAFSAQALLADAQGNSVIVNAQGKIFGNKDYQVNTNFNILDLEKGKSDSRYDLANEMLAGQDDISIDYLKMLLDRTHQEGDLTTIYSYIFDMKAGVIHVYYFHNYTVDHIIDIKKELQKGYRLENLLNYFPKTFAFETMALKNPEREKEMILSEIKKSGLDITVNRHLNCLDTLREPASARYLTMLEVALQLVKDSWNAHAEGGMWQYWFNLPDGYRVTHFSDPRLVAASRILDRLLARQDIDIKLKNFITEIIAYLRLVDGDKASAIQLYSIASQSVDECFPLSYQRAKAMLSCIR